MSILIWFGLALTEGHDLKNMSSFFRSLPHVVTIDAILILLFARWGWRCRLFDGRLVRSPKLYGTWRGHISSNWERDGKRLDPIPAILTVKQSLFRMSCTIRTAEMTSHSYAEGLLVEEGTNRAQLAYMYTSTPVPAVRERSPMHDGAAVLEVSETKTILEGRYWTERQTTGALRFEFVSRDFSDQLPLNFDSHPMAKGDPA